MVFTSLTKPILFLWCCKGLYVIICLDDILFPYGLQVCWQESSNFLYSLLVHLGLHIKFFRKSISHHRFLLLGLCLNKVDMSVSLWSNKLTEIQQLAHALLQRWPVTIHQVMLFLGKTTFCANGHAQLRWLCCVIQIDMFNVHHSLAHLFLSFHLSSSYSTSAPNNVSVMPVSGSLVISCCWCCYHYQCYAPSLGLLYSGIWGSHLLFLAPSLVLCARFILPCKNSMLFHSFCVKWLKFGYPIRWSPYIGNNSDAKAYLCNQGGSATLLLSRLACHILNLADKHGITLYSSIHTYPSQCGNWLSLPWWVDSHVAPASSHIQAAFHHWGQPEIDLLTCSHTNQCQHFCTLESSLPWGCMLPTTLGHIRWVMCFLSSFGSPGSSKFLAECVTGLFRFLILVAACWLEAHWLPTVLNMLADIAHQCPHQKKVLHRYLSWLLRNVYLTDKGSPP